MKTVPNTGQSENKLSSSKYIMNEALNSHFEFPHCHHTILPDEKVYREIMILGGKGSKLGVTQI